MKQIKRPKGLLFKIIFRFTQPKREYFYSYLLFFTNLLNSIDSLLSKSVLLSCSSNFFWSLDNFLGFLTSRITYISPVLLVDSFLIPFPFNLCLSPLFVPAGIVKLTFPYIVGISFLHPSIASVIDNGTTKYISLSSLS